MSIREVVVAVPLVVLTIAMGIFPQALILSWMSPSVDRVAQRVMSARELNVPRGQLPQGRVTQLDVPPVRPAG